MIIIQARIPVNSERRNVAYQRIHDFVDATRSESGCVNCDAFISLEDPDIILIHQAWRDADGLDRHANGRGLDIFLEALPEFVAGQVSTTRFETAPGAGEDVEALAEFDGELDIEDRTAPQGVTLH